MAGIAVIINNMTFFKVPNDPESKEMPNRTGTDLDAGELLCTRIVEVS
jgi:hypothetical protein